MRIVGVGIIVWISLFSNVAARMRLPAPMTSKPSQSCKEEDRARCLRPVEILPCNLTAGHILDYFFDRQSRECVKVQGGCISVNVGFAVEASCIDICWNCMSVKTQNNIRKRDRFISKKEIFVIYVPYKSSRIGRPVKLKTTTIPPAFMGFNAAPTLSLYDNTESTTSLPSTTTVKLDTSTVSTTSQPSTTVKDISTSTVSTTDRSVEGEDNPELSEAHTPGPVTGLLYVE